MPQEPAETVGKSRDEIEDSEELEKKYNDYRKEVKKWKAELSPATATRAL